MSDTSNNRTTEWIIGILLLAIPAVTFFIGRVTAPGVPAEATTRDTVIVTHIDTIVREKPVYSTIVVTDTMRIPVRDTVRLCDTLYLNIERSQARYDDSLYTAWVSGVTPALDSIRIYNSVQYITVTEQVPVPVSKRWSLGVNVGYGAAVVDKTVRLAPYIGVGIQYNLLSW